MEPLDEVAIRARTDSRVFARGEAYWKQGAVLSVVKRGDSLRAQVEGSDYEPYRVTIHWLASGEIEAVCTCPYADEWDEWCKHIVAVLLEHSNEIVNEQPTLLELLKPLSKAALVDLLVEVSEHSPKFYEAVIAVLNGEELEGDEPEYDY